MASSNESPDASARLPHLLGCPHSSYISVRQAYLSRHVLMHGASPNGGGHPDMPFRIPPMANYCEKCDIQFGSYSNYKAHKELYCSTRHVHKTISPPTSPSSLQQLQQQPQNQQHQPVTLPNQSRSPENTTATTESDAKGFNMVLSQPLYAAISTSSLIRVPCSYVDARGLIPARNILIPSPSTTPDSAPDSQSGNVIPTYTAMPGAAVAELSSAFSPYSREDTAKEEAKVVKTTKVNAFILNPSDSPKHANNEHPEMPLDQSFKKKESESDKESLLRPYPDTGNYISMGKM